MKAVRICYIYSQCVTDFLETNPCPGFGLIKKLYHDSSLTPFRGFNITFQSKTQSKNSDEKSDFIDDCVASLQANESDTIVSGYSMPIVRDHVIPNPVINDVRVQMITAYKTSNDTDGYDVLESLNTFSWRTIWVLLSLITVIIIFLRLSLWIHCSWRTTKRRQDIFLLVYSIALRKFCYVTPKMENIRSSRILVTLLVMLMFFVGFFYSSMIKTDQVTVKAPQVVSSYKDIEVDEKVKPLFLSYSDAFHLFRRSEETSFRYKVWQRAIKVGIPESVVDVSMETYDDIKNKFINQSVMIIYSDIMPAMELVCQQEM